MSMSVESMALANSRRGVPAVELAKEGCTISVIAYAAVVDGEECIVVAAKNA